MLGFRSAMPFTRTAPMLRNKSPETSGITSASPTRRTIFSLISNSIDFVADSSLKRNTGELQEDLGGVE